MNIFYLDNDLTKAAQYHVDKHTVKMPLEYSQLLCTAHHECGSQYAEQIPYRPTHKNHPSAKWTRNSLSNYLWLTRLALEVCKEYTYRYGKIHKCQAVIEWCSKHIPNIKDNEFTEFALAMPDEYKGNDPVLSYRKYYINEKQHLFNWKNRSQPEWIVKQAG